MKPALLLVDDETKILNCLRRAFLDSDYEIYIAENAVSALEILENRKIDLVISDITMPYMNGFQFLRKVAALYPSVARIILTGYAREEDCAMAVHENVADICLAKPFKNQALVGVVRELLEMVRKNCLNE